MFRSKTLRCGLPPYCCSSGRWPAAVDRPNCVSPSQPLPDTLSFQAWPTQPVAMLDWLCAGGTCLFYPVAYPVADLLSGLRSNPTPSHVLVPTQPTVLAPAVGLACGLCVQEWRVLLVVVWPSGGRTRTVSPSAGCPRWCSPRLRCLVVLVTGVCQPRLGVLVPCRRSPQMYPSLWSSDCGRLKRSPPRRLSASVSQPPLECAHLCWQLSAFVAPSSSVVVGVELGSILETTV